VPGASTAAGKDRDVEAGTRLTPEALVELAPGDAVTVESGVQFGRTRHTSGIVTRVTDTKVFVTVQSARGVAYVQEFSLRTGWRTGRGSAAALVNQPAPRTGAGDQRPQQQPIDALWLAWRRRQDDDTLRALYEAIGERLGSPTST
jgi:hypothetical protein